MGFADEGAEELLVSFYAVGAAQACVGGRVKECVDWYLLGGSVCVYGWVSTRTDSQMLASVLFVFHVPCI